MQLCHQRVQVEPRGVRLDAGRLQVRPDPVDGADERVKVDRDCALVPGGQPQARVVDDEDASVRHRGVGDDEHALTDGSRR